MSDSVKCTATKVFTRFVPKYGQVHGNPDDKSAGAPAKNLNLPTNVYELLHSEGLVSRGDGKTASVKTQTKATSAVKAGNSAKIDDEGGAPA